MAISDARYTTGKPMALLATLGETMPEEVAKRLVELDVIPLAGLSDAIEAIDVAAWLGQKREPQASVLLPRGGVGRVLSEIEAKEALNAYGLPIPKLAQANDANQASLRAAEIGFPIVLKGEGIAHKSEAGAVRLNLKSDGEVQEAARVMSSESFLVEQMLSPPLAELLIGVLRDEAHGYVLSIGTGGTLTELLRDTAQLLLPTTREAVLDALSTLKVSAVLQGYRGAQPAEVEAIVDAVMSVQDYVCAQHPLEVEINPLMCYSDGVVVADALIQSGETDV
jgi:acyl-CoA synthetase (NDP forming)